MTKLLEGPLRPSAPRIVYCCDVLYDNWVWIGLSECCSDVPIHFLTRFVTIKIETCDLRIAISTTNRRNGARANARHQLLLWIVALMTTRLLLERPTWSPWYRCCSSTGCPLPYHTLPMESRCIVCKRTTYTAQNGDTHTNNIVSHDRNVISAVA